MVWHPCQAERSCQAPLSGVLPAVGHLRSVSVDGQRHAQRTRHQSVSHSDRRVLVRDGIHWALCLVARAQCLCRESQQARVPNGVGGVLCLPVLLLLVVRDGRLFQWL